MTASTCAVGHDSYAQALNARIGVRRIPHGRLMGEDHRLDPRLLLQGPKEGQDEVARQAKHTWRTPASLNRQNRYRHSSTLYLLAHCEGQVNVKSHGGPFGEVRGEWITVHSPRHRRFLAAGQRRRNRRE